MRLFVVALAAAVCATHVQPTPTTEYMYWLGTSNQGISACWQVEMYRNSTCVVHFLSRNVATQDLATGLCPSAYILHDSERRRDGMEGVCSAALPCPNIVRLHPCFLGFCQYAMGRDWMRRGCGGHCMAKRHDGVVQQQAVADGLFLA